MKELFTIRAKKLRFNSKIGVFSQERVVGNDFEVSVEVVYDASTFTPEDLSSTISYAEIYEIVEKNMKKEWLLLETVAKAICEELEKRWPFIIRGKAEIEKLCPPIKGIDGSCSAEYLFEKS